MELKCSDVNTHMLSPHRYSGTMKSILALWKIQLLKLGLWAIPWWYLSSNAK